MDPESSASKKVKTWEENISSVDLNNKPQDFFFKYKNLTRLILAYLDVRDLNLFSRCSKYLFHEIHDKKNNYFKEQYNKLMEKRILLLAPEIDHKDFKKLADIVYILSTPSLAVISSLLRASFRISVDDIPWDKYTSPKIILSPGEYPAFDISLAKNATIIGLEYKREKDKKEDKYGQVKKAVTIVGPFMLSTNIRYENIRFELITLEKKGLFDETSILVNNANPIFEDCQFFGNCSSMLLTNSTIIFIKSTFTNRIGYCAVMFDSNKKLTFEKCTFFESKCGLNGSESKHMLVSGCSFVNCTTGIEWIQNVSNDNYLEVVDSSFESCDEAVFLSGGISKIERTNFKKNKIAVSKKLVGKSTISKNSFKENVVSVKLRESIPQIEKENTFENNKQDVVSNILNNLGVELETKYKDIDKEIIYCLEKGLCTYLETKTHHCSQEGYVCETCNLGDYAMICTSCSKTCHQGHNIRFEKISMGYCDCLELCNFCHFKDKL